MRRTGKGVAMKSKLGAKECPVFPRLMVSFEGGQVVILFSANNEGTVVYSLDNEYPVGTFDKSWDIDTFDDFVGEITLCGESDRAA